MQIDKDCVVAMEYKLTDDDGKVLDESGGTPLYYLHGHANIVPGLEQALQGGKAGDSVQVSVSPEDGYGTYDESLIVELPKSELPDDVHAARGARLMVTIRGQQRPAQITKVKLKTIVLDANHSLADKTLHFDVQVVAVRRATKDELAHGHAHGPGGHHHH